ncbi:uncharacterized protein LOC135385494 isoform X2 [Ornithodoros turicata]|uniref:uncharacterized protein LOC135385494 isoform X2 n=1 Tax=Ornithodoros turicata TaxID=34597 RepID=UPI003139735F
MVRLGMDRIRLGSFNKNDTCRRGERDDPPVSRSAESFDTQGVLLVQRCLIVQRDEKGYGLTVSGDNPVFVQSVKPGGAAARAGVHQGDRIIKVNGTLVTQSNHQDVVKLIKSGSYVALTLLGPPPGEPCRPVPVVHTPSISQPHAPLTPRTSGTSERITGPQPVDPEQQQQCTNISYQTIKKMLEKEQNYLDKILAECNKNPSDKARAEMQSAKKRISNLERQLHTIRGSHNDWQRTSPKSPSSQRNSGDMEGMSHRSSSFHVSSGQTRVHPIMHQVSAPSFPREWMPPPSAPALVPSRNDTKPLGASASMENIANSSGHDGVCWAKQAGAKHSRQRSSPDNLMYVMEGMDYDMDALHPPLNIPPEHEDPWNSEGASPELVSKKSRSASRGSSFGLHDSCESPHGTPPESPAVGLMVDTSQDHGEDTDEANVSEEVPTSIELVDTGQLQQPPIPLLDASFGGEPCTNPMEGRPLPPLPTEAKVLPPPLTPAAAAHASQQYGTPPESQPLQTHPGSRVPIQQSNIISMDDDEGTSDNELQSHLEDHGPFNSIWKLMRHPAHLSVFLHYLLTNTNEPSSLLFYIITDLYKLGSGKEMKKWAYEITSTFLVPHAPLAIDKIDETVLNEIDGVLQSSQEHEDELKAVFVKARRKAKEQLTTLLVHFRNTRTIGLSNIFIPNDAALDEAIRDKNAELRIIESLLVTELESLTRDEQPDDQKSALGSALATVLKNFGVKTPSSVALIDRFPTFVAKEKSRIKFFPRNKRFAFQTINTKGHHFQSQQYHCVTYCNHCQHIIWGVGDQGYQCSNCEMNIHKACVKVVEEQCIGSLRNKKPKKNHRMSSLGSGIMENIIPKTRKPQTSLSDRHKRPAEDGSLDSGICVSSEAVDSDKHTGRSERVHGEGSDHHSPHGSDGMDRGPRSKKGNSIGRSESFRQRRETRPSYRKRSDPNIPRSKSDVDVEDKPNNLNHSGSSSNSSLSTRSLESPSNSCEMVHRTPSTAPADAGGHPPSGTPTSLGLHSGGTSVGQLDDSDLECDTEPPNWQNNVDRESLRLMKPKERKRQDVINELFHTERTHVRNLKILERLFFRPLQQEQLLSPELLNLLFPNLDELLDIHCSFNALMKARRREEPIIGEIGEMMLKMMDGESGEYLKGAIATFCKNQSVALETLKNKQKKDQKLSQFLADAELHPVCRRLQLKDIIATGFQRLTKYPLLLENVAKYTAPNSLEHSQLLEAVDRSKNILAYVNQAVRDAENEHRLAELQRRMDRSAFDKVENPVSSSFKHLDLRKHRLVHEGHLTWRLSRQKSLEVLMVLLEDLVVLLQRQDERLLLRFHSTTLPKALGEDARLTHSPILRLQHVITRDVATDKKAFFLVTTGEQQAIYEFAAASAAEKKMWLHHITAAVKPHATTEQVIKRSEPERTESTEDVVESALDTVPPSTTPDVEPTATREEPPQGEADGLAGDLSQPKDTEAGERAESYSVSEASTHPALVDFHEVVIRSSAPFETAQHVLTPVERLRRKDQEVLNAIREKQDIVSEILRIPKGDYENVAEISEQAGGDKGPMELLLQITYQANNLEKLINEALNIKEEDAITAPSSINVIHEDSPAESSSASPQASQKASTLPGVPTDKLLSVTNPLVKYLTQLAPCIEEMERERQQLRKAVQQSRDQAQLLRVVKQQNGDSLSSGSQEQSRPCSFVSVTSSASDMEEQPQPVTVDETDATEAIIASSCSETAASANSNTTTGSAEFSEMPPYVAPPPLPLSDVFREACVQTSQEQLCCCPVTDLDEDTPADISRSDSDSISTPPLEEPVDRPTEGSEVLETKQNPEVHEEVEEEEDDKAEDATTPTPESTPSAVYF